MVSKQKFHLLVLSMNKIAREAAMILEKDGRLGRTLTAHDIATTASLILGDLTRYHNLKVHVIFVRVNSYRVFVS
jgi:hypothetical protein